MLLKSDFPWLGVMLADSRLQIPKMVVESLSHDGLLELKGPGNNPSILKWANELGQSVAKVYTNDGIPWCGLYMGILEKRAGYPVVADPLWALNHQYFGRPVDVPMFGDVLTFTRKTATGTAGHTALCIAESADAFLVHGGNQGDAVCFAWIVKKRMHSASRPIYHIGQPNSVKRIYVNRNGALSTDEA